jgi:hypothetical protein
MTRSVHRSRRVLECTVVFLFVATMQLWLVARAGTDVPFYDQWGVEGGWLYPAWREGSLHGADLFQPVNEHRIVWTHLLNLSLFGANGQWDPLVQLIAIVVLRATCAAMIVWFVAARLSDGKHVSARAAVVSAVVAVAFLPHLAWHGILWGFESQVYFALGFSMLALAWLGRRDRSWGNTVAGLLAGGAALLAMGPGALVPFALLGVVALRWREGERASGGLLREVWPALLLLGCAFAFRPTVPDHAALHATSLAQFFQVAGRVLGWPHVGEPWAALVVNVPILWLVVRRWAGKRTPAPAEDFVLATGAWSAAVGFATAWARGGSDELMAGVPSRYVDFLVLLPLANLWCAWQLAGEAATSFPAKARSLALVWTAFLAIGWIGLSAETLRGVVLPRAADRAAPVRLIRAFQETGNAAVFSGQPRLLVPHPSPEAVRSVLNDPRLRGTLPPSLQPGQPMGPLSLAARWLVGDPGLTRPSAGSTP